MRERENSPLGYYMIGIAALFLAAFLLLVILGAQTYRNTTAGQSDNSRTRALLAYVSAMVRANDMENAVSVRQDGPESSDVLVIGDGSGYASRIYQYGGYLVEDYAALDSAYDPKNAMKIGETEVFLAEFPEESSLLFVTTDEGSIWVRLRAQGLRQGGDGR